MMSMQPVRTKKTSHRARLRNLLATLFLLGTGKAMCQTTNTNTANVNNPLLDLFVKKGYVTQQEADQVQAEAEAEAARTNQMSMPQISPSKWIISKGIQNINLFGSARLRYEDRSAADSAGNSIDLRRFRYALQVGLRGDLFDQFYYGIRLDTGTSPRSDSVTFGTSASGGAYQGPFGRSNDGVDIGEVYVGWHPWSWMDITVGRMANPLYTTPMVWSPNITPEGFAERFKYDVGDAQFFANFGQFLYADLSEFSSPGLGVGIPSGSSSTSPGSGQSTDNIFMFAWQGGFTYKITPDLTAKVAATIYNYIGLQQSVGNTTADSPYFGDPYVGEGAYYYYAQAVKGLAPGYSGFSPGTPFFGGSPSGGFSSLSYPFNQVGLDHLEVLEFPFELNYKFDGLDAHLFGDFAYNLQGSQRAEEAANAYKTILANLALSNQSIATSFPAQTSDVKAYQIGIGIGSDDVSYGPSQGLVYATGGHRHSWEVRTYWQHTEQYALDPNLPDVDFFEGAQNMQGLYVAVAYGLTDNLIATFRYGHANRINDVLGTGGSDTGDIPQINPIQHYSIYQMDLTLVF